MREARIIVGRPAAQDEMHDMVIDAVLSVYAMKLAEAFGGYTATAGTGGWVDNGELITDDVIIFDVACEMRDATHDKLFKIATELGRALDQKTVYVRYPEGFVKIEDCTPKTDVKGSGDQKAEAVAATLDRDNVTETEQPRHKITVARGQLWRTRTGETVAVLQGRFGDEVEVMVVMSGTARPQGLKYMAEITDLDALLAPTII